jgi:hypothetical protein
MKTPFYMFAGLLLAAPHIHAQDATPSIDAAPVKITQRIIYNSDRPVSFEDRQKALALRNVARYARVICQKNSIIDTVCFRQTTKACSKESNPFSTSEWGGFCPFIAVEYGYS